MKPLTDETKSVVHNKEFQGHDNFSIFQKSASSLIIDRQLTTSLHRNASIPGTTAK
jgi:hypothetical protein